MKRLLFGMLSLGLVVGFATGCTSDPTAALRGSPDRVKSSRSFVNTVIGDSVSVKSWTLDEQGNTLTLLPTATSQNAAVATITVDSVLTNQPQDQLFYFVKGQGHGATIVIASVEGIADTIQIESFPAQAVFVSPPDTVGSGDTGTFACEAQDTGGDPITGDPFTCTYESADTDVVEVVDSTGAWTAKAPGSSLITVTVEGGAEGVNLMTVEPGTFAGTLSASTGVPGDIITVTKDAAGPDFDADTHVFFGGVEAFIDNLAAGAIDVAVPATLQSGTINLLFTGLGSGQLAQTAAWTSDPTPDDPYDPNGTPDIGPVVANGNYYIVLTAADVDNFFTVANTTGGDLIITITASWFTDADVDVLWCNAGCAAWVGNFDAATGANPEVTTVTIGAGVTWNLLMNLYTGATSADNVKFTVSGF